MDVKTIYRLMAFFLAMFAFQGCSDSDDEVYTEPALDVTPANIAGTWMLKEWNGVELKQGTYCYIVFTRKDRTFTMFQKFDSMYARCISGTYAVDKDSNGDYIISQPVKLFYRRVLKIGTKYIIRQIGFYTLSL